MQRKGVKNDNSENGKLDRHENGNVCDDNEMSAVGMAAERQSDNPRSTFILIRSSVEELIERRVTSVEAVWSVDLFTECEMCYS